jgi:hypothetical protein
MKAETRRSIQRVCADRAERKQTIVLLRGGTTKESPSKDAKVCVKWAKSLPRPEHRGKYSKLCS